MVEPSFDELYEKFVSDRAAYEARYEVIPLDLSGLHHFIWAAGTPEAEAWERREAMKRKFVNQEIGDDRD